MSLTLRWSSTPSTCRASTSLSGCRTSPIVDASVDAADAAADCGDVATWPTALTAPLAAPATMPAADRVAAPVTRTTSAADAPIASVDSSAPPLVPDRATLGTDDAKSGSSMPSITWVRRTPSAIA